jgi:hypothetical protein
MPQDYFLGTLVHVFARYLSICTLAPEEGGGGDSNRWVEVEFGG